MSDAHKPVFQRAVVALNGGPTDARIIALVADEARHAKAEIIAVHVVEIDWTLPLDADISSRSFSRRGTWRPRSSTKRPSVPPTCSSWDSHIASDLVASSPSAKPFPTS